MHASGLHSYLFHIIMIYKTRDTLASRRVIEVVQIGLLREEMDRRQIHLININKMRDFFQYCGKG